MTRILTAPTTTACRTPGNCFFGFVEDCRKIWTRAIIAVRCSGYLPWDRQVLNVFPTLIDHQWEITQTQSERNTDAIGSPEWAEDQEEIATVRSKNAEVRCHHTHTRDCWQQGIERFY